MYTHMTHHIRFFQKISKILKNYWFFIALEKSKKNGLISGPKYEDQIIRLTFNNTHVTFYNTSWDLGGILKNKVWCYLHHTGTYASFMKFQNFPKFFVKWRFYCLCFLDDYNVKKNPFQTLLNVKKRWQLVNMEKKKFQKNYFRFFPFFQIFCQKNRGGN